MLQGTLDAVTSGELGCYQSKLLLLRVADDRAARPGRRRCQARTAALQGVLDGAGRGMTVLLQRCHGGAAASVVVQFRRGGGKAVLPVPWHVGAAMVARMFYQPVRWCCRWSCWRRCKCYKGGVAMARCCATSRCGGAAGGAAREGWRWRGAAMARRCCYHGGTVVLPAGATVLLAALHTVVKELPAAPHTGVDVLPTRDEVLPVWFVMLRAGEALAGALCNGGHRLPWSSMLLAEDRDATGGSGDATTYGQVCFKPVSSRRRSE
jgi:hypothetical protein